MSTTANTPMLKQYYAAKEQYPGVLLAMRVGDFYEFYGDDAETASRELEIALTARDDGKDNRVSMAGVPYHAVEKYLTQLVAKGFKVALCDQVEDPKTAKGLVKRRVTRVITPGTLLEDSMLDSKQNNYLMAAITGDKEHGLSVVDVSTGEFLVTEICGELKKEKLLQEICRLQPSEVLLYSKEVDLAREIEENIDVTITLFDPETRKNPREHLQKHFGLPNLKGFGCDEYQNGLHAAALVLQYLKSNEISEVGHITSLSTYSIDGFLHLDNIARRHLEIHQNLYDGTRANSLISVLDQTQTSMGARLLRKWLDEPLLQLETIEMRLNSVEELIHQNLMREEINESLKKISDMERLVSRAATGSANPRDLAALKRSLQLLPTLQMQLEPCSTDRLHTLYTHITPIQELEQLLEEALVEEPPILIRFGNIIKPGFSYELDMIRKQSTQGKQLIADLEKREREKTGINNLKVSYTAVFGYFIEVPRSQVAKVPSEYERKQTTANSERYTTQSLKEYQVLVSGAEERIEQLEFDLFTELRTTTATFAPEVIRIARAIAELDVLSSLAKLAEKNRYSKPVISLEPILQIHGGRHPVVEQVNSSYNFVPNDCLLDEDEQRLIVLTGPNMSGKSTYIRQIAIIALMAQIGSFVPASSAVIGIVDRIFTRVGARDELATGQSTFMVEMSETANILNNATPRSLVILDEIGRGTSTYDGLAIAWAVVEGLVKIGCKTLFATHYHNLNDLSGKLRGVQNFRAAVKEQGDHVVWLHKIMPGGTDKSYGIQVARMAGVPSDIVSRARDILNMLEKTTLVGKEITDGIKLSAQIKKVQLTLFEQELSPILEELRALSLDELAPVEAWLKLEEWKNKYTKN